MVAFVHDHMPVLPDKRARVFLARKRLHNGDIDLPARLRLATANCADNAFADTKKHL
jgi:hypothetical protein